MNKTNFNKGLNLDDNDWINRHEKKFNINAETASHLSDQYLLDLIDSHSEQLAEIVKILKTLTKEVKNNRNLVTKASEVTGAITDTLNKMNHDIL